MSRRRSVLHSEKRHRTRNYKRRLKNLIIELILVIILIFVATKFVKKEADKPEVKKITAEEQKEIIKEQLQERPNNQIENELIIPKMEGQEIVITKATMSYETNKNQTIINIEAINYGEDVLSNKIPINLVDNDGKIIEETYVNIQELEPQGHIRLNIVCEGNLSEATKIEIRDERVN